MCGMGFFDDIADSFRSAVGSVDGDLLTNGLLGRADLLGVDISGMTLQVGNGLVERKATLGARQPLPFAPGARTPWKVKR